MVRRGMAFEGAGEMCIANGALTLQKPSGEPGLRALKDIGQGPGVVATISRLCMPSCFDHVFRCGCVLECSCLIFIVLAHC